MIDGHRRPPIRLAVRGCLIVGLLTGLVGLLLAGGLITAGWVYFHPRFDWQRGIAYGEWHGEPLALDVLTPTAPNGLGIVFIVSGGDPCRGVAVGHIIYSLPTVLPALIQPYLVE